MKQAKVESVMAEVRTEVAESLGLVIRYTNPDAILDRYDEMSEQKHLQKEQCI